MPDDGNEKNNKDDDKKLEWKPSEPPLANPDRSSKSLSKSYPKRDE